MRRWKSAVLEKTSTIAPGRMSDDNARGINGD